MPAPTTTAEPAFAEAARAQLDALHAEVMRLESERSQLDRQRDAIEGRLQRLREKTDALSRYLTAVNHERRRGEEQARPDVPL